MARVSKGDDGTDGGQPKQMCLEEPITPGGKERTLLSAGRAQQPTALHISTSVRGHRHTVSLPKL